MKNINIDGYNFIFLNIHFSILNTLLSLWNFVVVARGFSIFYEGLDWPKFQICRHGHYFLSSLGAQVPSLWFSLARRASQCWASTSTNESTFGHQTWIPPTTICPTLTPSLNLGRRGSCFDSLAKCRHDPLSTDPPKIQLFTKCLDRWPREAWKLEHMGTPKAAPIFASFQHLTRSFKEIHVGLSPLFIHHALCFLHKLYMLISAREI